MSLGDLCCQLLTFCHPSLEICCSWTVLHYAGIVAKLELVHYQVAFSLKSIVPGAGRLFFRRSWLWACTRGWVGQESHSIYQTQKHSAQADYVLMRRTGQTWVRKQSWKHLPLILHLLCAKHLIMCSFNRYLLYPESGLRRSALTQSRGVRSGGRDMVLRIKFYWGLTCQALD